MARRTPATALVGRLAAGLAAAVLAAGTVAAPAQAGTGHAAGGAARPDTTTSWTVAGRVLERGSGRPVVGAEVAVPGVADAVDTTDRRGRYRLALPDEGDYDLDVDGPALRYVPAPATPVRVDGHERRDVVLTPSASLTLRVLGRRAPLVGATLALYRLDPARGWVTGTVPRSVPADASGRVRLRGLVPGVYRVGADARRAAGSHAPAYWRPGGTGADTVEGAAPVRLRAGRTTRLGTQRLGRGSGLHGTVTRPDGTPAAGVRVVAGDLTAPLAGSSFPPVTARVVATDARGRFSVRSLAAHDHTVCAVEDDRTGCAGGGSDPAASPPVVPGPGEGDEVRLVLPWP